MIQTRPGSRIEVWETLYINNPHERLSRDEKAMIVQILPGSSKGEYMVEVIDSGEED